MSRFTVTPGCPALIRGNSPEYSCVAPQPYFQLSYYHHCFYSKRLRRILFSSSLLSALVSLRLSHISPCHLLPKHRKHTHTCAHSHTHMHACTHASKAEKGRPNASFDVMALWSLSWFPLLLCSSIIHNLHIVCLCVYLHSVEMWFCQKQNLAQCEGLWPNTREGETERQRCGRFESVLLINMLSAVYVLLYLIAFQLTHLPFSYATVYTVRLVKKKLQNRIGSQIHIHIHIHIVNTYTHTHGMIR